MDPSWNAGPTKGMVADSVVVIAVRKGNPKGIKGWDDLVKPGIKIITPNPASSGSARWNTLAAYQHTIAEGGSAAQAKDYLTKFFSHVQSLPGSGRDATNAFLGGDADALISYENEAILARQSGEDFDYVVPDETVLIENPAAVTTKATPKAKDYLDYVLSADGQAEFAAKGFRPVVAGTPDRRRRGRQRPGQPLPDAGQADDDRRPRRLGRGQHQVLRGQDRHRLAGPAGHGQEPVNRPVLGQVRR